MEFRLKCNLPLFDFRQEEQGHLLMRPLQTGAPAHRLPGSQPDGQLALLCDVCLNLAVLYDVCLNR